MPTAYNSDWAATINHMWVQKIANFLPLLYQNLINIHANKAKCLLLMHNLVGFLLQFTEVVYYNHERYSRKYNLV